MATILDFRPAEGKIGSSQSGEGRRSPCEIVIFPGVRYERWETSPPPAAVPKSKASKQRRAVKRDTLELKD